MSAAIETTSAVRERTKALTDAILRGHKTQCRLPIYPQPAGYPDCYPLPTGVVNRGFFARDNGSGIGGTERHFLKLYGAENVRGNGGHAYGMDHESHERWECPWRRGTQFVVRGKRFGVTLVLAERLQSIDTRDIAAEGVPVREQVARYQRMADSGIAGFRRAEPLRHELNTVFAAWWDEMPGQSHPWASNPWMWVISFKRLAPGGAS